MRVRAFLCEKHRARRGPNQSSTFNEGDARIYVRACAHLSALLWCNGGSDTATRIPYRKQVCAQCGHAAGALMEKVSQHSLPRDYLRTWRFVLEFF